LNAKERFNAVLNYQPYDRMPVMHFGFWGDTIAKWRAQGHLEKCFSKESPEKIDHVKVAEALGFDHSHICANVMIRTLVPGFPETLLEKLPDGTEKHMTATGVIELRKPGVVSIPAEVDHTLKDRRSWEKEFLPRLAFSEKRIQKERLNKFLTEEKDRETPLGIHCGSLYGEIRGWMGIVGLSYLYADDYDLYVEIIITFADLQYRLLEIALGFGIDYDYAHFWEDICYNHGPLINPKVFRDLIGPHYKRMTDLCKKHGIHNVSVDCDGKIDDLLPIWLANGVNVMFPIEVGTWNGNIQPWRDKYGRELRGIGGMDKRIFAMDYAAVDKEIERLKPLIASGGYIPCPDHQIPPDAKWENVQYYCEKLRRI